MDDKTKIRSSIIGLDALLGGGIKKESMVLLHGPPFCGKKLFLMQFLYEQLNSSNPTIFVLTDFGVVDFQTKMKNLGWDITNFEKSNLCFFIDAYSKQYSPYLQDSKTTKFVSSPAALSELSLSLSKIQEEFSLQNFFVGWHSLSTVLKNTESNSFFKFLSFEIGKLKKLHATAFFTLEKNVHSKQEEFGIEHLMDGVIEFENAKILAKGFDIFDVQWHPYSINENGISIL
ncbi:MAG: RAD55 family ATPase [Candidatus Anstonellaceae archaeon]